MAMIFQEPMTALNPVLTVGEQVAEVVRVHRDVAGADAWAQAVDMLARVGIPDAGGPRAPAIRTSSPAACGSA